MKRESWRDIAGFEGVYQISDFGRVKSLARIIPHLGRWGKIVNQKFKERILRPIKNDGYNYVYLSIGGKLHSRKIHRMVAETFIPNPKNKPTVNHKDGNRSHNEKSNLEWATVGENNRHGVERRKKAS